MRVFGKVTLSYPLYELIKKYSNSSFAQGSRQGGGRCLPGNWCSGPCYYMRRSLTFRPRVQCCVAWYNALPAHLPSKIERVQMRALRIIYLWKLYSLFKSLDLRTGAVSSVWALWKYLQKAGPCQPVMKQHLSIYFIFLFIKYLQYFFSVWKHA